MARVLIVDDDEALRDSLAETVGDLGYESIGAKSGREALSRLADDCQVDAIVLDLRMPGEIDGMEVLRRLRDRPAAPPVTVLTAFADAANTIEAMRLGAYDHLTKPIGRKDLSDLIGRMVSRRSDTAIRETGAPKPELEGDIIGTSEGIRKVHKTIGLSADSDANVLITGETGTGKELVARALHVHSRRSRGPFIPVNCAAIPADLLESEFFGHVRGSFTGAVSDRRGAFRDANGGTLFLDEIGDMSLAMQAKILRVLQDRVVAPVGGRPEKTDVRLVAATHRDLPRAVADGSFRQDLFYRLNVIPVVLPPLRERIADILPLAGHFLVRASAGRKRLAPEATAKLLKHSWPGNVRELRNVIERAAILARADVIEAQDLAIDGALHRDAKDWFAGALPDAVARLETEMIRRALERTGGNRAEAARALGIQRQLLYAKMERYGLTSASEKTTDSVGKDDGETEP